MKNKKLKISNTGKLSPRIEMGQNRSGATTVLKLVSSNKTMKT
ncbi:hypothetical protein [Lentimicrobium sp. S6]|nr:hypothetical protein [Lentimicrobium sp. S6]